MADRGALQPRPEPPRWPDPPPEPSRGSRAFAAVRALRDGGWLRPRRIGCLLLVVLVLVWLVLVALSSAINSTVAVFRNDPPPVSGSPFDPVAPTARPAGSGSPTIDRITGRGRLIVAVREVPGLAERAPGSNRYTGFDLGLLDLIARDLGVDPGGTSVKLLPPSGLEGVLDRREADLVLGGYEITPQRRAEAGIAGPYLVSPLRLAVPAGSPVTGLDSLGGGDVCAPRNSLAAGALAGRLGDRLKTRGNLGACANLLPRAVVAIAGEQNSLAALPDTARGALRLVGEPLGSTEYGIGLPPGDEVFRQRVTAVLCRAIEDGTWARLYQQYLGTPVPDRPPLPC